MLAYIKDGWIKCAKCGHKLAKITGTDKSPTCRKTGVKIEIKCQSCKAINKEIFDEASISTLKAYTGEEYDLCKECCDKILRMLAGVEEEPTFSDNISIGVKSKAVRSVRKLTSQAYAKMLGISFGQMSRIESNQVSEYGRKNTMLAIEQIKKDYDTFCNKQDS